MIGWLLNPWAKVKAGLAIAGAVIIGFAIAFLKGRRAGIEHVQAEQNARRIDAIKTQNQVEDDINSLGAQDVDDRLRRWNRIED